MSPGPEIVDLTAYRAARHSVGPADAINRAQNSEVAGGGDRRPKRILVVDDERTLRLAIRHVLEKHGYIVLEAATAIDALEIVYDQADPVDMVIVDVIMPEISGAEVGRAVSAHDPLLPVIYMSDHRDDIRTRQALHNHYHWMLTKPLYPAMLMAAVQNAFALAPERPADLPFP